MPKKSNQSSGFYKSSIIYRQLHILAINKIHLILFYPKLDVQGKNCGCEARVLSFHLAKSDDGNSWEDYKENTMTKVICDLHCKLYKISAKYKRVALFEKRIGKKVVV